MNVREILSLMVIAVAMSPLGCSGETGDSNPDPAPDTSAARSPSETADPGPGGGNQDHSGGGDMRPTVRNPVAGAFGASCAADAECDSGVCFHGGHGSFCSVRCTASDQCPQPSSGDPHCNPHGYCRY